MSFNWNLIIVWIYWPFTVQLGGQSFNWWRGTRSLQYLCKSILRHLFLDCRRQTFWPGNYKIRSVYIFSKFSLPIFFCSDNFSMLIQWTPTCLEILAWHPLLQSFNSISYWDRQWENLLDSMVIQLASSNWRKNPPSSKWHTVFDLVPTSSLRTEYAHGQGMRFSALLFLGQFSNLPSRDYGSISIDFIIFLDRPCIFHNIIYIYFGWL